MSIQTKTQQPEIRNAHKIHKNDGKISVLCFTFHSTNKYLALIAHMKECNNVKMVISVRSFMKICMFFQTAKKITEQDFDAIMLTWLFISF